MAPPTASLSGEGAIAAPAAAAAPAFKNPFLWVPIELPDDGAHLRHGRQRREHHVQEHGHGQRRRRRSGQSILGFPYMFKFLWAPALELYKTKKFFVVLMQFADRRASLVADRRSALRLPGTAWVAPALTLSSLTAVLRRDAGHRHRRRLRHHAAAQGSGEVSRLPEHVLERGRAARQGPVRHREPACCTTARAAGRRRG